MNDFGWMIFGVLYVITRKLKIKQNQQVLKFHSSPIYNISFGLVVCNTLILLDLCNLCFLYKKVVWSNGLIIAQNLSSYHSLVT